MAGGTETSLLTFTSSTLASGSHTLHVQERDSAGNWSPRGTYSVVIDRTPPSPPTMNTSTGMVYAAFSDAVKRNQPGSDTWVDAGTGLDMTWIRDFTLAPDDGLYIVGSSTVGTHVKRLVGSSWQDVGTPEDNAESLQGGFYSLAISSQGIPYLAIKNFLGQAILMRFTGAKWMSAKSTGLGTPLSLDLAMGANDQPYLGVYDINDHHVYVVTTDPNDYESKWDTVGSGPATGKIKPSNLTIKTHSNQVYLGFNAYTEFDFLNNIQLLVSNGGSFTSLLSVMGKGYGSDFDISSAGVPVLALIRPSSSGRLAIMGYFGSTWINVGTEFEFAGEISDPKMAITRDGVPYISLYNTASGGKQSVIRTSFDPDP
ncbi:MAG TPA: hypothetical protein VK465_07205 [Fibrobacteria bacterium]|nr:hypothetical protein [Fibrobacteria bacterium]